MVAVPYHALFSYGANKALQLLHGLPWRPVFIPWSQACSYSLEMGSLAWQRGLS